ncbi:hypothetical protein EYF80_016040 [Liparis tanakae]|uniref:Uncharacterized protein n=1 Tax=Liparis tanakae TaxID=230148 RepID=A0A4Z2I748_9TELE|nr:hypothetical protein EYF80_016040 [Liparis tanakae]
MYAGLRLGKGRGKQRWEKREGTETKDNQPLSSSSSTAWSIRYVAMGQASNMEPNALWHPTRHRVGDLLEAGWGGGGEAAQESPRPATHPSIVPPSYAIIFALLPIST